MKISLSTDSLANVRADLAVAVFDPKTSLFTVPETAIGRALRDASDGFRTERYRRERLVTFEDAERIKALLVFSTTLSKAFDLGENVKIFAARSLAYARDYGYSKVVFLLDDARGREYIGHAAEAYVLADYRFDKYKHGESERTREVSVSLLCRPQDRTAAESALVRYRTVAEAVNDARDLVNEPGDKIYPKVLADAAKRIAKAGNLGIRVVSGSQLEKAGYRGLIAVGKGSIYPPCLIVLRYRPKKRSKHHLALVGKGITFDTGGISIKPAEAMWQMKGDMAGGAAVLGAMSAIAKLRPSLGVTGIVAAAENFPGPKAQRPGDIFVAKNGKSVMVDNTDAEGRLVLTDALARAGEEKATHIVDAATLTGSCVRALGQSVAGIMGNDPKLIEAVIRSGKRHGELYWELPLVEEYRESLKTPYADVNNIGGKNAGAITAGLFLREFVPERTSWAHLDIAGPFIMEKPWKYYPEGATGFGVKTFVDLAERFEEYF
ncbi:MAG TPA: leucyl aminopeptidase [Vicinamibacteria bacterium]|nr:leucyl aminopeptidase [Vicinamibacteria bacterium]